MPNNERPAQAHSIAPAPAPPSYNSGSLGILWYDLRLFIAFFSYLPGTCLPLTPCLSGSLDELYPSAANLWGIFLHLLFTIFQLAFLFSLFFCVFPTVGIVLPYVLGFLLLNYTMCMVTLNGRARFITSTVDLSQFPKHDNERWIFINGVAVGQHWLQSNVTLLAKTFGREILGVHNPTYGFLFDIIQCLVERDFLYNTQDTRDGYLLVKDALQDPRYDKVVLIVHSQGGIQGSLIVDMLIAELSEDDLHKLEVYTFAAAANHFNNPIRRAGAANSHVIRHIEHYANSGDFVSRWGILSFAKAPIHLTNRFVGRLFERRGSGHMLNQHYLNTMFTRDPATGRVAETNEFMEMLVDESPTVGRRNQPAIDEKLATALRGDGNVAQKLNSASEANERPRPVKELSRLWKYRNGLSPQD